MLVVFFIGTAIKFNSVELDSPTEAIKFTSIEFTFIEKSSGPVGNLSEAPARLEVSKGNLEKRADDTKLKSTNKIVGFEKFIQAIESQHEAARLQKSKGLKVGLGTGNGDGTTEAGGAGNGSEYPDYNGPGHVHGLAGEKVISKSFLQRRKYINCEKSFELYISKFKKAVYNYSGCCAEKYFSKL